MRRKIIYRVHASKQSETTAMILKRWGIYLLEMYQPVTRLIFAVFSFLSILWLEAGLKSEPPRFFWGTFALGVSTMMLILLYYRICDEFKDLDTDMQFFPERPLPSGRVSRKDLHYLRAFTVVLAFALNLIYPLALWPFLLLYGYAFLMGKWFFIPAMANHRLWAFVTHSPISLLGYLYLLQLSATDHNQGVMALLQWQNIALIFWLALPGMIWEITRKTRAPAAEEVGYQTYSQILGYKGASGMAIALILGHLCLTYWLWFSVHLLPHLALAIILGAAILAYLGVITAFCFQPERFARYLQPVSEIYVAAVLLIYPIHGML